MTESTSRTGLPAIIPGGRYPSNTFAFQQLPDMDIYPHHCGPVSLKYATGRDDLSVLDCATAIMAREEGMKGSGDWHSAGVYAHQFTPGSSSPPTLTALYQDLGFEDITLGQNEPLENALNRMAAEGYTYGAIMYPGHIIGVKEGVVYDWSDNRRGGPQVSKVWGRRSPIDPDASARLDEQIKEGRVGGLSRDFCLSQVADITQRLDEIESATPSIELLDEHLELTKHLARWRAYCDRGDILGDREVCKERATYFADRAKEYAKYGQHENAERYQHLADLWSNRCAEAVLPTLDLCERRAKMFHALSQELNAKADALRKKGREFQYERTLSDSFYFAGEKLSRLCADTKEYQQERYSPPEQGFLSPSQLVESLTMTDAPPSNPPPAAMAVRGDSLIPIQGATIRVGATKVGPSKPANSSKAKVSRWSPGSKRR